MRTPCWAGWSGKRTFSQHRPPRSTTGHTPAACWCISNGTEAGLVLGRYWSGNHKPPEGAEGLFRKDLGRTPGEAVIRYDGSTLTIQCAGAIHIEAGGAVTINGATIDLN